MIDSVSFKQTRPHDWSVFGTMVLIIALGLLLRLQHLGNTFQSGDNAALAWAVSSKQGNLWMFQEQYGVLINVLVKGFALLVAWLHVGMTEFWWKCPVALLGTAQIPLTFFFLRRLGYGSVASIAVAGLTAVFPLHVMQSRYLWGYEALGTFFVTLALWAIIDFLENPDRKSAFRASFFSGLYMISHGFIMPFPMCVAAAAMLFGATPKSSTVRRFFSGVGLLFRHLVWVGPLLFFPMCLTSLYHGASKKSFLGFFIPNHFSEFVQNIGVFLLVAIALVILGLIVTKKMRSPQTVFLVLCGASYLAPFAFLVPRGITSTRGYMLIGTYCLVLSIAAIVDKAIIYFPRLTAALVTICLLGTFWGTVNSIFYRGRCFDPSLVRIERGAIPIDPGMKAAGYLIREYVPQRSNVLALIRNMAPANMGYYCDRKKFAFYNVGCPQAYIQETFLQFRDRVDVVLCEPGQRRLFNLGGSMPQKQAMYGVAVSPTGSITNLNRTNCSTGTLQAGQRIYSDCPTKFKGRIPKKFIGMDYLVTRNEDKNNTSTVLLSFDAKSSVTVYVIMQNSCSFIPAWMKDWEETGEKLSANDHGEDRTIFKKRFSPGRIELGTNCPGKNVIPRKFEEKTVIYSEGKPQLYIYARPWIPLPKKRVDTKKLNRRFDKEYSMEISGKVWNLLW